MARRTFGGVTADFVATITSTRLLKVTTATLTFWDAKAGGNQHTDLLLNGAPVSSITVGEDGQVPEFEGPDGVNEMWADAGGGRVKIVAPGAGVSSWDDLTDKPTIPATADDVGAEPAGLSAETEASLNAAYADKALVDTGRLSEAALSATIASQKLAPRLGFAATTADRANRFLAFHPTGDIIAANKGSAGGKTLVRSADSGKTWATIGTPDAANSPAFLWFSQAGTWFVLSNSGGLFRSTDGNTWAQVANPGGGLGECFAEEPDGTLWFADYNIAGKVYRSTDDGLTWTQVYDFPSTDNGDTNPVIRHVHALRYLAGAIWVFTGDNNTQTGFWRWDGSTFVRQSPAETDPDAQRWRTVGITERDGHFYWVQDGASLRQPAIFKADPADLAGTVQEIGADLPTGGWYTANMADGTILICGVVEDTGTAYNLERDKVVRVWAIDTADRVSEVFTAARVEGLTGVIPYSSIQVHVRDSDQLIGLSVNGVDVAGTAAIDSISVYGHMVRGGTPFAVSRATLPGAYPEAPARMWAAAPATDSPTYAANSFAVVPGLTLNVPSNGRPLLLLCTMSVRSSLAGEAIDIQFADNGANLNAGGGQGRATVVPNGVSEQTVSLWALHTPLVGTRTLDVRWKITQNGGTATLSSAFKRRSFTVIEL